MKITLGLLLITSLVGSSTHASEQEKAVNAAIIKLSESLKIEQKDISLANSKAVSWRSSALGCPQPGMHYMQMIIPGYQIKLKANNRYYQVHSSSDGKRSIICLKSKRKVPIVDPDV